MKKRKKNKLIYSFTYITVTKLNLFKIYFPGRFYHSNEIGEIFSNIIRICYKILWLYIFNYFKE